MACDVYGSIEAPWKALYLLGPSSSRFDFPELSFVSTKMLKLTLLLSYNVSGLKRISKVPSPMWTAFVSTAPSGSIPRSVLIEPLERTGCAVLKATECISKSTSTDAGVAATLDVVKDFTILARTTSSELSQATSISSTKRYLLATASWRYCASTKSTTASPASPAKPSSVGSACLRIHSHISSKGFTSSAAAPSRKFCIRDARR